MKTIEYNDKNSGEAIQLAYSDFGNGQPVVLIHGWPLSREMWEYQLDDLVAAGFRVVKYDRRGFGHSTTPWTGYDYDSLAADLNELLEQLDLKNAILVGFSMGGGEVARYIGKYGEQRLAGVVLISSVLPYLQKAADNEEGVDASVFEEIKDGLKEDRIGFLEEFGKKFFGVGLLKKPVSAALLQYYLNLEATATRQSTLQCVESFAATDFRTDIQKITVPALIIHGDSDKTVPIEASSDRTATMIPHAEYLKYDGAPHGLFYTHKEQLNADIIRFIKTNTQAKTTAKAPSPSTKTI